MWIIRRQIKDQWVLFNDKKTVLTYKEPCLFTLDMNPADAKVRLTMADMPNDDAPF